MIINYLTYWLFKNIGNPKINGKQMIEFVPNCVATLEDQEITAIWLKPKDLPR